MVHNTSNTELTIPQMEILSKGLSFVRTPKPTTFDEITLAYNEFKRRIHLKCFFKNAAKPTTPSHIKSGWEPPVPTNENVNDFLSNV